MKKTLIIAGIATLALAGSIGGMVNAQGTKSMGSSVKAQFFGTGGSGGMMRGMKDQIKGLKGQIKMTKEQMTAIQTAVKNNDYKAFVMASGTGNNPGTGEFAKMVSKYNKNQAIKTAVTNNDYNAFVTAKTPSKEEFAKMVDRSKIQISIKAAITNKDYNAFLTAIKSDANRPTDVKTPTQDEFNKIVEKSANMPEGMDMGFGGGIGGGHKGKGGPR